MTERIFHKDGQLAYAYNPAQAINLRADGWVEQSAPQPAEVIPEPTPNPANTAPASDPIETTETPEIPEESQPTK